MQGDDVAFGEELLFARRGRVAVGARFFERIRPRPHQNVHAERPAVTGHNAANATVAVNAERLAAQRLADADLPLSRFEGGDVLRNKTHRVENQSPRQFRRGIGRRAGMLARRDDNAAPRAGLDIDMRIDAALADELQFGQLPKERRANLGALAKQHQNFGIAQSLGQQAGILHMIVPDRDIVAVELAETRQRAQRVEIVVEDGDFHEIKANGEVSE